MNTKFRCNVLFLFYSSPNFFEYCLRQTWTLFFRRHSPCKNQILATPALFSDIFCFYFLQLLRSSKNYNLDVLEAVFMKKHLKSLINNDLAPLERLKLVNFIIPFQEKESSSLRSCAFFVLIVVKFLYFHFVSCV